ncbi:MAG: 4-(cytidine 5'-diphospho)-2-C-methyl-D-erythritol kinase [Limnobacter sp.]|nr:4-(cytidine 5'-diphospho)-2-C-methyl-D-erythritol kinase [Limnobacter sp.]
MIELAAQCPAKINLFLHVVGRRPDGYHLLESIFCPIGLVDDLQLNLNPRQDGRLVFHRTGPLLAIPEDKDLTVKACKAFFQLHPGSGWDVGIHVTKRIPEQAGLGGGSSNAAQVLRLLNKQFKYCIENDVLLNQALSLGADVPFFMQDDSAFVEGIGEQITPIRGLQASLLVYKPKENCPTHEIFASSQLTRDSSPVKIAVFDSGGFAGSGKTWKLPDGSNQDGSNQGGMKVWRFINQHTRNSLQAVVEQMLPSWQAKFQEFSRAINVFQPLVIRMSGSGSSWFAAFQHQHEADQAHAVLVKAGYEQQGSLFKTWIK